MTNTYHITFNEPLRLGTVLKRPNRFIMHVELDNGETVEAHCPVSGRIGGYTLDTMPVLISGPYSGRKTPYTVEAVALHPLKDPNHQWIGVNQNRVNHHIKELFQKSLLDSICGPMTTLESEVKLNDRRIDFKVNGEWVEVKMPLLKIHATDSGIPLKEFPPTPPSDRMPQQLAAMTDSGAGSHLLVCFSYHNDKNTPLTLQLDENIMPSDVAQAKKNGLKVHVLETRIDPYGLTVISLSDR